MNKRLAILILLTGLFVLTIGTALAAARPNRPLDNAELAPPHWFYEEIDVPGFYFGMGDRSLRVSHTGVPHLAYGASHLYLARYQDGAWTSELVDDGISVGEGASLALDASGHPHIAYKDNLAMKLKYAYWTGQNWQIQTLFNVVNWNLLGTAIDLDPAGQPHIIYGGDVDGSRGLYYAHRDGDSWLEEMLVEGLVAGPSITVDDSGVPHISFNEYNGYGVRYGRRQAGAWLFEDVGPAEYNLGSTSLALDSAGQPHIAYLISDWDYNTDVMYAVRQAGVWTTTTAMMDTDEIGLSLILDDADTPHIANDKTHLTFDGAAWHEEKITGLSGSYFESIALDQAGRPIICALHYGGPLQCARHDGLAWSVDDIADGATTGYNNALAVTSDHELRAVYRDYPNDNLLYAVRQPEGWSTEVITKAWTALSTDLLMDAEDQPHLCLGQSGRLQHVYWDGLDWSFEQIDSGFDAQCTIRIDNTGRIHVAYIGRDQVQYALQNGQTWQIDSLGGEDETVSLALDTQNRPHLVYFDGSGHPDYEHYLRHAVLTQDGWLTETVDSDAWFTSAAIAIDKDDGLHVAYLHKDEQCQLRYALWNSAHWQIETVAENMCQGEKVELGLDSQGRPHITIWDAYYQLIYAGQTDTGWQVARVSPARTYDNDLVVDGAMVYVSFVFEPNRGLLLASSLPLDLHQVALLPLIARD